MILSKHPVVKIEHLYHKYNQTYAIQDINIEVNKTGILGLLGSNGAGKSTTMNILCGVLNQTKGNVYIDGIDMQQQPEQAKRKLGFLPQNAPLYFDFTVDEYLTYCARLRMIESDRIPDALERVKQRCNISHFSKRLIKNLSGGYRQRVGIAQAIIHQPKLVVLDEPTNGLDPNQILEVRSLIKEIAEERAVVFSSHILSEVEVLCDDIIMIENGVIVFADSMTAFNNYIKPQSLTVHMERAPARATLLKIEGIEKVVVLTARRYKIFFTGDETIADTIIRASLEGGWELREISFDRSSVEEVFAQLSGKK